VTGVELAAVVLAVVVVPVGGTLVLMVVVEVDAGVVAAEVEVVLLQDASNSAVTTRRLKIDRVTDLFIAVLHS
jgi:hypothetical protein